MKPNISNLEVIDVDNDLITNQINSSSSLTYFNFLNSNSTDIINISTELQTRIQSSSNNQEFYRGLLNYT